MLIKAKKLPTKAPMNFPAPLEHMFFGTTSKLGENLFLANKEQQQQARGETNEEVEKERQGERVTC